MKLTDFEVTAEAVRARLLRVIAPGARVTHHMTVLGPCTVTECIVVTDGETYPYSAFKVTASDRTRWFLAHTARGQADIDELLGIPHVTHGVYNQY